ASPPQHRHNPVPRRASVLHPTRPLLRLHGPDEAVVCAPHDDHDAVVGADQDPHQRRRLGRAPDAPAARRHGRV
ncbi:hypothetical protein BN1708_017845, partial [Verticillium longisporum]